MKTECTTESAGFHPHNKREVVGRFDGGKITSDGGGMLLREVEARTGIIRQFAACFKDYRSPLLTEHSVPELIAQRVYALALGYEDLNDHDELRNDPTLAVLVGKEDPEGKHRLRRRDRGKALAGKSTLNRLELGKPGTVPEKSSYKKIIVDVEAVERLPVDVFLQAHRKPPKKIVLDLDATDDPLHGEQEGRFFHGYYRNYCYLPLYIFCGGDLLCAKLRPSNIDASAGAVKEVERIVRQIRQRWGKVRIILRGDSGFCREEIMAWCESNKVEYVLGLAKNSRLREAIECELKLVEEQCEETGRAARMYKELQYKTLTSWTRTRRVVGKAEHLAKGSNPRFVVTSLDENEWDSRSLYEDLYCARGDMENRIKEQQLYLFADRTSTHFMDSNQIRLWFSSVAYMLMHALRRMGLKNTELEQAQCHTIRLKLLKIGALIRITVRKIWLSFSEAYPYVNLFRRVMKNIRRWKPLRC
jgi:hypothetical protein